MRRLIAAIVFVPALAFAQPPAPSPTTAPPPPPAAVLVPPGPLAQLAQVALHPRQFDAGDVVALLQEINACVQMQPAEGVVRDTGACPAVSAAVRAQAAAQAAAVAAARAEQRADDTKVAPYVP